MIRSKRYRPIRSRNQLVLDLANPEVREYLIEALSKILKNGNITYVKWDMNRHLTDLGSAFLNRENQGELSHRYVLGLYSILEYLTEMFPDVLLRVAPAEEEDLMQECFIICRRHGQVIIQMLCAD